MKNYLIQVLAVLILVMFNQCTERKPIYGYDLKKVYDITISDIGNDRETQSACVDRFGNTHVILIESGFYIRIDQDGKIVKKTNLLGSSIEQFDSPNYIQCTKKNIIISDIRRKEIKFFDYDMNYLKRYTLPRFPIKFRVHDNRVYYICDFLETTILNERLYSYKVFMQPLFKNIEIEVFAGNKINVDTLIKRLDFNDPGTIDFDTDDDYIYAIRHQANKYMIYKINADDYSDTSCISLEGWKPIVYEEEEKEQKKEQLFKIITKTSNYPKEKILLDKKIAITTIKVDPFHNIWACSESSISNTLEINIFSNQGELVKSINISGFIELGIDFSKDMVLLYETNPTAKKRICLYKC